MPQDLLGEQIRPEQTTVDVFHDERLYNKDWLYHGLLVVERRHWQKLASLLADARNETDCHRAVHFKELNSRSSGSNRTKLALRWVKGLDTDYLNFLRFFLLGIDLSKLDQSYFGDKDSSRAQRNMRIYNKFFEIALFTALRWFFNSSEEVSVTKIFAEKRCLPNDDPFTTHAPQMIRRRESNIVVQTNHVSMIDAKAEKETAHPGLRDCLQIVDVYTGALSQLLDNSNCKSGCCEVATALAPRAKKLMEQPFNSKSCCWKRVALRFFPKSSVTGDGLLNGVRKGEMYEQRQLTYLERDQLRLFD